MSRPTPRRPASSRSATPRPRRIAGGRPGDPPAPEEPVADEPEPEQPDDDGVHLEEWPTEEPGADEPEPAASGSALSSPRVTRMLLVLVGVLAVVLVLQSLWWLRHSSRDEAEPPTASEGAIAVPGDLPVLPTELAVQEGVEAAAQAAVKIISRTYQGYDEEVASTSELLTEDFAAEYQQTTDDVREAFLEQKTTVEARVIGQGVVRANETELQALLFIDQFVVRDSGKDPKTTRTPYRALLTMVNTDQGWLVDDMQTE